MGPRGVPRIILPNSARFNRTRAARGALILEDAQAAVGHLDLHQFAFQSGLRGEVLGDETVGIGEHFEVTDLRDPGASGVVSESLCIEQERPLEGRR